MAFTLQQVVNTARNLLQSDGIGLTQALALDFTNVAALDFHRELIMRGVDASQVQEAYRNLTAGTGTYLYPSNMFFAKSISFNFANTNGTDYKAANKMDVSITPMGVSFEWLRLNQPSNVPLIDDHGDWFEVFPTPTASMNLSQAFRLFYYLQPTSAAGTVGVLFDGTVTQVVGAGTVSSSGTTVTGVGTSFATTATIGGTITASGQTVNIINIISNTSLTTDTPFAPAVAASTYTLSTNQFTETVPYLESLDYRLLSYKIASIFKAEFLGQQAQSEIFEKNYQKRLSNLVTTLTRGSQMPIKAQVIPLTGWEF